MMIIDDREDDDFNMIEVMEFIGGHSKVCSLQALMHEYHYKLNVSHLKEHHMLATVYTDSIIHHNTCTAARKYGDSFQVRFEYVEYVCLLHYLHWILGLWRCFR